eukprot:12588229-Alexandrium_andersonii.AAC.1
MSSSILSGIEKARATQTWHSMALDGIGCTEVQGARLDDFRFASSSDMRPECQLGERLRASLATPWGWSLQCALTPFCRA